MVYSLIQNTGETMAIVSCHTAVKGLWSALVGHVRIVVGEVGLITSLGAGSILGAYHPRLLALYTEADRRQEVCYRGLRMLYRYYYVTVSSSDVVCLSAFIATSGAKGECILNGSRGSLAAKRWMDRMIGASFNELAKVLPEALDCQYSIASLIEAAFFGRFMACI